LPKIEIMFEWNADDADITDKNGFKNQRKSV